VLSEKQIKGQSRRLSQAEKTRREKRKKKHNARKGGGNENTNSVEYDISKLSGPPVLMLVIGRFERKGWGWLAGEEKREEKALSMILMASL